MGFHDADILFLDSQNAEVAKRVKRAYVPYTDGKLYECSKCKLADNCVYRFQKKGEDGRFECGMKKQIWDEEFGKVNLSDPLANWLAKIVDMESSSKLDKMRRGGALSRHSVSLDIRVADHWRSFVDFVTNHKQESALSYLYLDVEAKDKAKVKKDSDAESAGAQG